MRRTHPVNTPGRLRAVYTIQELAELMGLPAKRVWAMVRKSEIRVARSGTRILVPISSFRIAFPDLWDSIVMVQQLLRER